MSSMWNTPKSSSKRCTTLYLRYILLKYLSVFLCSLAFAIPPSSLAANARTRGDTNTSSCDVRLALQSTDGLLKQGRYAEAKAILGRLRECKSLSPVQVFTVGWFYGRAHDFKTALGIFALVDANVPDPQTHAYAVALSQFALADYQDAVRTLKTLQAHTPLNGDCTNLLAVSYSKLGQYQAAYPLLVAQLRKNPRNLYAYLNLVTLLSDAGQFSEAEKIASQAVIAFPGNSEVLVVRGAAYSLLGELDKAHSDFANAIRISPEKADPRFFWAVTDYKLGKFTTAASEIKASIRSGVVDSDLYYLLAECMLKIEPTKPTDAIAELNHAIELNGKSVPALTLRGKLVLEQGDAKSAVKDLEAAHEIDPTLRSATYNLARAYSKLGRQKQATALFQQLSKQSIDAVTELSNHRMKQALSENPVQ